LRKDVPSGWRGTLRVCGKCSRKLGGGFGPDGRQSLAKALARASGGGRKRKAPLGVVEVKCLGLCPRRAVVLVDAGAPGRWHLVPPGRDAGVLLAELGYGAPDA
jgi:predicted metal-binding protein